MAVKTPAPAQPKSPPASRFATPTPPHTPPESAGPGVDERSNISPHSPLGPEPELPPPVPAPVVVPPPEKIIPLEETVRKAVETRRGVLVNSLDTENKAQAVREEEVRQGRVRIDAFTAEIADMEAFLARS